MHKRIKVCAVVLISFIAMWGLTRPAITSSVGLQVKSPEKITLSEGKKPGSVNFDHKAHEPLAEKSGKGCVECHHTSTNAKLKTEKPPKCASCHAERGNAKNPKVKGKEIWVQEAFHGQCQSCHKQAKKGPVRCMECHVKKV
jgi:hypothetical protein